MIWLVDLNAHARRHSAGIGPGRLVLVVGPSGAGKDTLLRGAQEALRGDQSVVFPRRVVTRPPSPSEDNTFMTASQFEGAAAQGVFALWWAAHGHQYGIPIAIDDHIRDGRIVVCNVSRTIVGVARRRYAAVAVVLVTAPPAVRAARLAARQRPSDGLATDRLWRVTELQEDVEADFVIHNTSRPAIGVRRLINVIRDTGIFIVY